jgi:hypothetical protein
MTTRVISWMVCALAAMAPVPVALRSAAAAPLGTAFTYQGQLQQSGTLANGTCDFQFDLFAAASGGSTLGTQAKSSVTVSNGLFTIPDLDFGSSAFTGDALYLGIGVRCPAGSGGFTVLDPRQPLTATPYALYAPDAGSAPWTGLTGVPAGFSDNTDNDTLGGLSCSSGQIPERSGATWVCAADDDTTYTAGTGLALSSNQFSVNTAVIQARVSSTCAPGSSIRAIDASGGVTCESDDTGGSGTVTSVTAGTGLTGGTITTSGTISVNFGTSPGTAAVGSHDHMGQSWSAGTADGLRVETTQANANGLVGIANSGSNAYGVWGIATAGVGVIGSSTTGSGVRGRTGLPSPLTPPVGAVYGDAGANAGVVGTSSDTYGLYGESNDGPAVYGLTHNGIDAVFGESQRSNGNGVHGRANVGASAWGVLGDSTSGVGVRGASSTGHGVEAYGGGGGTGGAAVFAEAAGASGIAVYAVNNSIDANLVLNNAGTGDMIRAFKIGDLRFRVDNPGNVYADGSYNCGLGSGCFNTGVGADVAERVDHTEPLRPGDVVEIDPERPDQFRLARTAYSTLVAGVISSTPGITLNNNDLANNDTGERTDNRPLLALVGRVQAKATAENGPIRPGDLLVASAVRGHAMRAGPSPGIGSVIGKALGALEEGNGSVAMLVMLR